MSSEPWLSLAEHLDRAAAEGDLSGTVLVTVGDRTLLHACHGLANRSAGVPVMKRTRFGVASLSKMFTAAAVLSALDDAGVDVHTRVADLFPERRRARPGRDRPPPAHPHLRHGRLRGGGRDPSRVRRGLRLDLE